MIFVSYDTPQSLEDAKNLLDLAIKVEFATLPPYLYALYSIKPGTNPQATDLIRSIAMEEMIHMCLACNMLNAIGGDPVLTAPRYPGGLPGHIADGSKIRLLRFSKEAMHQGMMIELPEHGALEFPTRDRALALAAPTTDYKTIGQLYTDLDNILSKLDDKDWHKGRNQIGDSQFLQGEIFPISDYAGAKRAINIIIEEGEGTNVEPLALDQEYAHYYKFAELYKDAQLTVNDGNKIKAGGDKSDAGGHEIADRDSQYVYMRPLGVNWDAVYDAIPDPGDHDFAQDSPEAQNAQLACDKAYTLLVQNLQGAVSGQPGRLGLAARNMFDLRMAAQHALTVPLACGAVSGPRFLFRPELENWSAA